MPIRLDPDGHETAALAALVPTFAGLRVVEIGCGDGRLTRRYADPVRSLLAIDPDEAAVARFRETMPDALRGRIDLRVGPLASLDLPAASADVVLFSWSL